MSKEDTEAPAVGRQLESDEDNFDDDEEESWNDLDEEPEPTKCIFCDEVSKSIEKSIEHLNNHHQVDLRFVKRKFNLDQYAYIKMINYIKIHEVSSENFKKIDTSLWNDDKYLKPVEVDSWLMFDIEDLKDSEACVVSSEAHQIDAFKLQIKEKDALIEQLLEQVSQMKSSFHALIDRTENTGATSQPGESGDVWSKERTHVANIPIQEDESYFVSYAHFDIHYDMLSDSVRTNTYRQAILNNRNSFENKIVMDIGCGTGILSMFSSQAGARRILAIDQSEIIYHAMDIAQKNEVKNIEFVKGRLENMDLPLADGEKVDIIVSEWMGYFLLFEGMLDSVIYARDKYLKPGGLLLPNRCTINLVGLGDEDRHSNYIGFWKNVYGFDMGVMQSKVLKEACVETCCSDTVITDSVIIADLNMHEVDYTYPNFIFDFELKIQKAGKFTAFVGYFDTFFELPQNISFSTGPNSTPTHWKQVVFYVKEPVTVAKGDIVKGKFHCSRGKNDARALRVKIEAFDQELYYNLS